MIKTMNDVKSVISKKDIEGATLELKTVDAFLNDEKWSKVLVSFANRDGGTLVFGVRNDGSFEGPNIFDRFSDGGKSGIDKLKEKIVNVCHDKIGPALLVNVYHDIDVENGNEVVLIVVPKRRGIPHAIVERDSGGEVRKRQYFVRSSHGTRLVSDKHLEWMFQNTGLPIVDKSYAISITTLKNLKGIPLNLLGGVRTVLQPMVVSHCDQYLHQANCDFSAITFDEKLKFVLEMVLCSIFQTIEGTCRVVHPEEEHMPSEVENMTLGKYVDDVKQILYKLGNSVLYPRNCSKCIEVNPHSIRYRLENSYMQMTFDLVFAGSSLGLGDRNPYAHIYVNLYGIDGQEALFESYENFLLRGNMKVVYKYPDEFDDAYYQTIERVNRLVERIELYWDIDYFMEKYPHYHKNYETDLKLEQVLDMLKKMTKSPENNGEI